MIIMPTPRGACKVCVLLCASFAAGELAAQDVDTCDTITLARPGQGVSYRGSVHNSAYRFSATIPAGLKAWGAGRGAPFHGFVIYLNGTGCINFQIHVHIDLPEQSNVPSPTQAGEVSTAVGNKVGTRIVRKGLIGGKEFDNIFVYLSLQRDGQKDDVELTLITPAKYREPSERIFADFISHLRFW
jgi:hypothetical protein